MTKKTLTLALILVIAASCTLFGYRSRDNRQHNNRHRIQRNLPDHHHHYRKPVRHTRPQRRQFRKPQPQRPVKHNPYRNRQHYNRYQR